MTINLRNWMDSYQAQPYALGHNDCTMALADWAVANGYQDPVEDYRDAYHSESEMYQQIEPFGDLVGLVTHFSGLAGLHEIERPAKGCIGVIGSAGNVYRQWGAIWDGSRWQVHLKDGFIALSAHSLKLWRI